MTIDDKECVEYMGSIVDLVSIDGVNREDYTPAPHIPMTFGSTENPQITTFPTYYSINFIFRSGATYGWNFQHDEELRDKYFDAIETALKPTNYSK